MEKHNRPNEVLKLEGFSSAEFNSWKRKAQYGMKFMKIFYTCQTTNDECVEDVDDATWVTDEDLCRKFLLNGISDRLADVYMKYETTKQIWDNLLDEFKKEEKVSKTHLVDKFMDFYFKEENAILPQVKNIENLVGKLKSENTLQKKHDFPAFF